MYINKDELEDIILQLYRKCREENSESRRKVLYGQLYEKSFLWCKYILYKKLFKYEMSKYEERNDNNIKFEEFLEECVREFGAGIFDVIYDLVKLKKEPKYFFYFFNQKLIWKKAEFDRDEIYQKGIKTSKNKTSKVYQIDKDVTEEKSKKGRELSEDELADIYKKNRMDIHEYEMIKYMKIVESIEYHTEKTDDDIDILEKHIAKSGRKAFSDALKSTINSEKESKRRCCRALLTLFCYKKNILFEEIIPVLNDEVLELCKETEPKNITYKEIYMKYPPDSSDPLEDGSVGASASRLLNKVLLPNLNRFLNINNH